MDKFWTVWMVGSGARPMQHTAQVDAEDEAKAYAAAHPGVDVFIMEAVSCASAGPPVVTPTETKK